MTSLRKQRRQARVALLQSLFEWQWKDQDADLDQTIRWLDSEGTLTNADREYFGEALAHITDDPSQLDSVFQPFLDRDLHELGGVELAALRGGTFELQNHQEIPKAIVINEWVELTKRYGATDSFKYVNGVLDNVASKVC